VTSYPEFTAVFGASTAGLGNPYLAPSVAAYFANGGVNLVVVRVAADDDASLIGLDGGAPGARTGLQALLDVDQVSVVAIPGAGSPAVQTAMITHCENAGDRMAILDPAVPGDINAIQAQRAGLESARGYGALYFPWIQAAPTGASLLLPPSGFVAGAYAATAPPDAPVGVVSTATGLAHNVTTAQQDILNGQGIDTIRNLSGIRIWGARTLAADPEWIYVSVRRTALCVEESIAEGTAWCLTQPNYAALWTQLQSDTEDFLFGLWQGGWFQGVTPNDGYFVQCGLGSSMSTIDLLEDRTIVRAGIAPRRPAEFIILSIVHERSAPASVPAVVAGNIALHAPAPNPFNPRTEVRFSLTSAATVSLHVVDAAGRRVRTLADAEALSVGEHRRRWDGADDAGRALPSGVYFVRVSGGGEAATRSVVLVR
jgi:phage tail sheath protein FI